MNDKKYANPAVVGLAGFSMTTLVLQFHNVGWCGLGPVIVLGLIFGGLAQLIAGFGEQKMGNNFGYCAFTAYATWPLAPPENRLDLRVEAGEKAYHLPEGEG